MILTADAEAARANRRTTPRGWSTPFIGANRYTIRPGDPIPAAGALHPVAFLVERGPGGVTKPHFHQADQFQVFVGGYGKMGPHETGSVAVHYTDAYSAYGPIVAAEAGIAWFTLRNGWDPGAKYMTDLDSRAELRASRDRHTHWETTTEPEPALDLDVLRQTAAVDRRQVLEGEHGLASWRYRLPPRAALAGPDPAASGGQFWVVLAGTLSAAGAAFLGIDSVIFVGPDDGPLDATAGPGGAEALCLQFRVPFAQRH
ncbi:MAG TPA: hypothetical protein VG651_14630 [Stellaceae bacterium]|nr:hypothetical protein [Stellaceae bacterium]